MLYFGFINQLSLIKDYSDIIQVIVLCFISSKVCPVPWLVCPGSPMQVFIASDGNGYSSGITHQGFNLPLYDWQCPLVAPENGLEFFIEVSVKIGCTSLCGLNCTERDGRPGLLLFCSGPDVHTCKFNAPID